MEHRNYAEELHIQLQHLEKHIAEFERDRAESVRGDRKPQPEGCGTPEQQRSRLDKLRRLLNFISGGSSTGISEALRHEKDLPALKQEIENAKHYISLLRKTPEKRPGEEEDLTTDLALTEEEDRAHNQLESERREFKNHYDALEHDFESREKKLLDELRDLGERTTKQEVELEHLRIELQTAREKMEAAESKASSASLEMMEMNVFNKSAAAAIKEKDLEISDLKQALQEARGPAAGGKNRP